MHALDLRWIAAEVRGDKIYAPDGTCLIEDKAGSDVGYVLERKVFDRALAAEAAKAIVAGDVTKAGLKEYEDRWRAAIGMNLERSYEYKEFFIKLHDEGLDKLLGPMATEDISKMGMRGVLRVMSKLNPKLLWNLRHMMV